jgi:hypothetical protein
MRRAISVANCGGRLVSCVDGICAINLCLRVVGCGFRHIDRRDNGVGRRAGVDIAARDDLNIL